MPSRADGVRPRLLFAVLCVATASYAVLQSLVVPALGVFRRELHTTPSGAAWILTAFLLSASVSTPILGRLADLHGKRPVLVGALAAMSAGSAISAAADGLGPMVGGRLHPRSDRGRRARRARTAYRCEGRRRAGRRRLIPALGKGA